MKLFEKILACLVFLCLSACNLPFGKDDPVVVSVGNRKLTQSEVYRMVPQWDSISDREKLGFLERWIDEEVIYQEAMNANVMNDTILSTQIESTIRKMVVDFYLQTFADTMMIGDSEKLNYYQTHRNDYLRGKTTVSGAILHFKDWASADAYYKEMKTRVFNVVPTQTPQVSSIVEFENVAATPDSCMIPDIVSYPLGKLSVMRYCNGGLKMAVVTERLDSADVRPYKEVSEDVSNMVWIEHRRAVMDRLKKEWKMKRPIFSKMNVFNEKESQ
ncbi:hypothetical protein [uncultured Fibrobacter sp.]|uniref:hypothetical protein n=1 Tax=uncultured Fibrobacter sp. TaxID=261512 RepID=UPI0025EEF140|nr:hypothetical protein [uncultured Fibrobacter sp.]